MHFISLFRIQSYFKLSGYLLFIFFFLKENLVCKNISDVMPSNFGYFTNSEKEIRLRQSRPKQTAKSSKRKMIFLVTSQKKPT